MLSLLFPAMRLFPYLYQLTFFYSNLKGIRGIVYLPKYALAVIGATVSYCGIGNGDVVVFIPVLECFSILVVNHLVDISIHPTMAPDEEGLTLQYHISRRLNEQPV